jgi:hypothetical protein
MISNWREYLGFFVHPSAHVGHAAVYDHEADEGTVHVFPTDVIRGSKGFAFGWGETAIPWDNWTDDGSSYVELHTGVTPRFDQWATMEAGDTLSWRETWYPVQGLGGVDYADEGGAVSVTRQADRIWIGVFSVRSVTGTITVAASGEVRYSSHAAVDPEHPFSVTMPEEDLAAAESFQVTLSEDGANEPFLTAQLDRQALTR